MGARVRHGFPSTKIGLMDPALIHIADYRKLLNSTPILISVHTRTATFGLLIQALRSVEPKILYIASDGPRNSLEVSKVRSVRSLVQTIDWDCSIVKIYSKTNVGMYEMSRIGHEEVFRSHDSVIRLEDDCIPTPDFFRYLNLARERYGADPTVAAFCGFNPIGKTPMYRGQMFLSSRFYSWGYLIKKEFWSRSFNSHRVRSLMPREVVHYARMRRGILSKLLFAKILWGNRIQLGHGDIAFQMFLDDEKLSVCVPSTSLIKNIGSGPEATHTKFFPHVRAHALRSAHKPGSIPVIKRLRRIEIMQGWLTFLWFLSLVPRLLAVKIRDWIR